MIEFSEEERAVVEQFDAMPPAAQVAAFWSDPASGPVAHHIKRYFIALQRRRCCYCRHRLGTSHGRVWDVEHIVPRTLYPAFMFVLNNLAVSCVDCNNAKSDVNTLTRKVRRYPSSSMMFKIVHPHFDVFSEHIYWNGENIFLPRTSKGKWTIYSCDLLRYSQAMLGVATSVGDDRFESEVDLVFQREAPANEINAAIAELKSVVEG